MAKIEKPAEWFDKILPEKVASNPDKAGGFNGTFSFNLMGDNGGNWSVTLQDKQCQIRPEADPNPVFTITMKDEDFVKLMNGELNGQVAFMSGKLKFKGAMSTAMKLQGLLF